MFTLLRGFKTTDMTPTLRNLSQYYYSGDYGSEKSSSTEDFGHKALISRSVIVHINHLKSRNKKKNSL